MKLSAYDGQYVRIQAVTGETFSGLAEYGNRGFLECEYGGDEDGIFIEDVLIYASQIALVEEIRVHGTAKLLTENLILRRFRLEDAEVMHERFGKDPEMSQYSGWNPYATQEMAWETVQRFIAGYGDDHAYSWVMDWDDILVGTIGAYDYADDQIEIGFSVGRAWQGRGFATEAVRKVLWYLTENEGIPCVTAWCAEENAGSRRVLEKSGMQYICTEKDGITAGNRMYDKRMYEFRKCGADPAVGKAHDGSTPR